jgi:hypothetical protein
VSELAKLLPITGIKGRRPFQIGLMNHIAGQDGLYPATLLLLHRLYYPILAHLASRSLSQHTNIKIYGI